MLAQYASWMKHDESNRIERLYEEKERKKKTVTYKLEFNLIRAQLSDV